MDDSEPAVDDGGLEAATESVPEALERAADERDLAALVRDEAADARDVASTEGGDARQAADDRVFAAADRAAGARDRRRAASRAAAALVRDEVAEARDELPTSNGSAHFAADDRVLAAADRAAGALDRQGAATRDAAALVRDEAAEARDIASAGTDDAELAADDRAASALDRHEAALDRREAADSLENAHRDDLTDTLLRDAGLDQLSQAVDRAHRVGEPLVIAYLDVDHLKEVNDEQGHASGDRLLHEVGSALRTGLRSYDVVVRYGGDEFVCALPGSQLTDAAQRFNDVATDLSAAIANASVSIGLAELKSGESLEQVIGRADHEMYDGRKTRRTLSRD